ncbi:hypothetical protein ACFXJ5_14975 [Streptomyces sp. NPDC059373]
MARRTAVCEICMTSFTPDKPLGRLPRRCSQSSCRRAAGPSDDHAVHDDWGRRFTDDLVSLAVRMRQQADADTTAEDSVALLEQVAELRDLTEYLTRVAIFKARTRHAISWGDIGRILKLDGKTVSKRWAPGNTLSKVYHRLGGGAPADDATARAVPHPGPDPATVADSVPPATDAPVPRYFLRASQAPPTGWWPPPSWPTWPAAVWPSASVKDPQPDRTGR